MAHARQQAFNEKCEIGKQVKAEPEPVRARLIKKNGYTVGTTDRPVDEQVIKQLLAEFP